MNFPLDLDVMNVLTEQVYKKGKLKWMSPVQFLKSVPNADFFDPRDISAWQSKKGFSRKIIDKIKEQIRKGEGLSPLYLNYTDMRKKFPAHDGRHRAMASYELGIKKIPVIVVR